MAADAVLGDVRARPAGDTRSARRQPDGRAPEVAAKRGDIQGMRAVAVLLVVLSHAGVPGFSGGYVGVDVFFVISGFLITGILVREVMKTGSVSIAEFYARRARRILPAASVVLVAICAVSVLAFNPIRLGQVLRDVVWAALFSANIHSALSGTDYFQAGSFVSPVQHFWSLAVEEQFYLVWPPVIALVTLTGFGRGRHLRSLSQAHRQRRVGLAITVLVVLSLLWSLHATVTSPTTAYFSTFTRGWELGLGALLAVAAPQIGRLKRQVQAIAAWAGLAMILAAATTYDEVTPFPGKAAALPVVGAALVIAGGLSNTRGASALLSVRPMRWVGDISYSLYLWHWPLLIMPAMYQGRAISSAHRLVLVGLAIGLSAITYRYIETPARTSPLLTQRRVNGLLLWPAAVSLVLGTVLVAPLVQPNAARAGAGQSLLDPDPARVQNSGDPIVDAVGHAAELAVAGVALPRSTDPSLKDLKHDNWHFPRKCWASTTQIRHDVCAMGDVHALRTIVLYGDSHIGMWGAPVITWASTHGWKVVPFLKTGCFPADVRMWRTDRKNLYEECQSYRPWALDQIGKIHPEYLLTAGWVSQPFADPHRDERLPEDRVLDVLTSGLARGMGKLSSLAGDVWVIGDGTLLPHESEDCLAGRNSTRRTCSLPLPQPVIERNQVWRAAAEAHNAHFLDIRKWFCDDVCPVVIGSTIVYTDSHHITRTYLNELLPSFLSSVGLTSA